METLTVRKVGVKFRPAALVMTYSEDASIRRRCIPVRNINKDSDIENLASEMRCLKQHSR